MNKEERLKRLEKKLKLYSSNPKYYHKRNDILFEIGKLKDE